DGATATAPSELVLSFSKTACQVVPLLTVFHKPPEAAATYMIAGLFSTTARSTIRPPMFAGPIERRIRLSSSRGSKDAGGSLRPTPASRAKLRVQESGMAKNRTGNRFIEIALQTP